ncbi:MAG: sugar phosphate isomerase/epimerase [Spirochaetaceae bacterium]|nr:sugar phosphate isomerase/epimerase [Spirochaetaceae bacterium]MCF7947317.1 sugar phosphate isomerase/epimerase [Spirochaetia bacterium]MCF7950543.1 sugar phosphate isomerase/epimerase [Spirochaetaceae bacterium]
MKPIGLNTACLQRKSNLKIEEILEIVSAHGFSAVEFKDQFPFFEEMSSKEKRKARDIIEKNKLFCSVHLPFVDMNLSAFDSDLRMAAVQVMKKSLQHAVEIGAQVVTVHGGNVNILNYGDEWIEVSEEFTLKSLKELMELSNEISIRLSIENLHEFSDRLKRVHSRPEALLRTYRTLNQKTGFTFDIGHAHSTSIKPERFVEGLGPQNILLSHIHDNNGKDDQHKAVGEGSINFKMFFEKYVKEKWKFPLVIETRTFQQALVSKERIELMLKNETTDETKRKQ